MCIWLLIVRSPVVTMSTACWNLKICILPSHCRQPLRLGRLIPTINTDFSLNNVNGPVFASDTVCIVCEARNEFLYLGDEEAL